MKKQMQVGIFLAVLIGSACSPNTGSRETEQQVATSPTYTMEQEANGSLESKASINKKSWWRKIVP